MAGMEAWLPNDRSQQATQAATPPVKFLPSRAHKASLTPSEASPLRLTRSSRGPRPERPSDGHAAQLVGSIRGGVPAMLGAARTVKPSMPAAPTKSSPCPRPQPDLGAIGGAGPHERRGLPKH